MSTANARPVYAIVVTYQGAASIKECLSRLLDSNWPVHIIVVDNASTDGTIALAQQFRDVSILRLEQNVGFGRANNHGMSHALNEGAEFLFLLNQDVFVQPETIETLAEQAHRHDDYGILAPLQLDDRGQNMDRLFFDRLVTSESGNALITDSLCGRERKVYPVSFVNAAAWLLRSDCVKRVGGFDPLFFMYGEDNDYCQRAIFHGWKIGIVPCTHVLHTRDTLRQTDTTACRQKARNYVGLPTKVLIQLKDPSRKGENILARGSRLLSKRAFNAIWARDLRSLADSVTFGWNLFQHHRRIWKHRDICRQPGPHWLDTTPDVSKTRPTGRVS